MEANTALKKKIFGTDGVRGTANVEPVTAETALKLGRAAAHVFKNLNPESRGHGKHKIVIGKDTRLSGYMLENAISSGILSMGVDVFFIEPVVGDRAVSPGVAKYLAQAIAPFAGSREAPNCLLRRLAGNCVGHDHKSVDDIAGQPVVVAGDVESARKGITLAIELVQPLNRLAVIGGVTRAGRRP